jgi:hypothetical protein
LREEQLAVPISARRGGGARQQTSVTPSAPSTATAALCSAMALGALPP